VGNRLSFRIISADVLRTNLTDCMVTKTEQPTVPNFPSYVVENITHSTSFNIVSQVEVFSVNMDDRFLQQEQNSRIYEY
jgi:hypothetical protein